MLKWVPGNSQKDIWTIRGTVVSFSFCIMSKGLVFSLLCPTTGQKSEMSPTTKCPWSSHVEYKSIYRDHSDEHREFHQLWVPKEPEAATRDQGNPINTCAHSLTDRVISKQINYTQKLVQCQLIQMSNNIEHLQPASISPWLMIIATTYNHLDIYGVCPW